MSLQLEGVVGKRPRSGGNDQLNGGGGSDKVLGGSGSDSLTAGDGKDTLNDGTSYDTALYTLASAGVTRRTPAVPASIR